MYGDPLVSVIRKKKPMKLIEFSPKTLDVFVKFSSLLFKAASLFYFIFSKLKRYSSYYKCNIYSISKYKITPKYIR